MHKEIVNLKVFLLLNVYLWNIVEYNILAHTSLLFSGMTRVILIANLGVSQVRKASDLQYLTKDGWVAFSIKENVMNKFILATTITLITLCTSLANAASVTLTPNTASGSISATVVKGTLSFNYSGSSVVSTVVVLDQNELSNQNYGTVGDKIETTFSLPANTFATETVVDVSSNSFKADISGSSTSISSDMAYDYLAIHFGGYEVFFQFSTLYPANTAFNISNVSATKGGGLSNYRVYNSGLSEVPVPAAAFLFAPALLGFMGLRRKAKNLVA